MGSAQPNPVAIRQIEAEPLMLFVWNDPEGNSPPADVTIPRIEATSREEWTDWHWYTTIVNANCREIIDNVVDMAQFFYVQGATQYMNGGIRPDLVPNGEVSRLRGVTSVASYYGPFFVIDDLTYHYDIGDQKATAIALGDFVKLGFEQDVAIWKNKAHIDNSLLCEEAWRTEIDENLAARSASGGGR